MAEFDPRGKFDEESLSLEELRQLGYLVTEGDEMVDPDFVGTQPLEKKKRFPSLKQQLNDIYQNADDEQKVLLKMLEQECQNFTEMNSVLQQAKIDYVGCRLCLDAIYYSFPTMIMISELVNKNVSWETLVSAGIGYLMVRFSVWTSNKIGKAITPYKGRRSPDEELRFRRSRTKDLIGGLDRQTSLIKANFRLLGLMETQEFTKPYQISSIVGSVLDFLEEKHEEERFELEIKRKAGLL